MSSLCVGVSVIVEERREGKRGEVREENEILLQIIKEGCALVFLCVSLWFCISLRIRVSLGQEDGIREMVN